MTQPAYRLRNEIRHRKVGNDRVVVRQEANEILVLNELGARVLEAIEARSSMAELTESIVEEFEVERPKVEADLQRHLAELVASGVIEPDPAAGDADVSANH